MAQSLYRLPCDLAVMGELEERRSRFLVLARRSVTEEDARAVVVEAKKRWPEARHYCSAFLLSGEGDSTPAGAQPRERSSDDGEPAGTAGQPMLEALRGSGIVDVSIVVARYFGGVKLGTGGLVRAYSSAVSETMASAPRVRVARRRLLRFALDHAEAGRCEAHLRGTEGQAAGIADVAVEYGQHAVFSCHCAPAREEQARSLLAELTAGRVEVSVVGETTVDVPVAPPPAGSAK